MVRTQLYIFTQKSTLGIQLHATHSCKTRSCSPQSTPRTYCIPAC